MVADSSRAVITLNNRLWVTAIRSSRARKSTANPTSDDPAKASSDYLGKWVKVRGVIVDIRRKSGIAGSYYFIVTMRDEQNKTDKRLTFNFGSHNSADVEALSNGSVATIVGQVHQVQDSTIPTLQNPKVVK